jgi:hypothetical protein
MKSHENSAALQTSEVLMCFVSAGKRYGAIPVYFMLLAHTSLANASDMNGAYYLILIPILLNIWPLILPLAFLRKIARKVRAYCIMVLATYGVVGVVGIPWSWFTQIASLRSMPISHWLSTYVVLHSTIAFALSVWALAALRRYLSVPIADTHEVTEGAP